MNISFKLLFLFLIVGAILQIIGEHDTGTIFYIGGMVYVMLCFGIDFINERDR